MEKYLTEVEFAKKLGVSRQAIWMKIKKGDIKGVKLGRDWFITQKEADKWINIDHNKPSNKLEKKLTVKKS